ncbi:MAG: aminoacyl-tRNA hydrolase [Anaerolineales bacterium]
MVFFALGNPGARYARTRHNFGWMAVEKLAGRLRVRLRPSPDGPWEEGQVGAGISDVLLVRPLTYMNRAGAAATALLSLRQIPPSSLVAVYDDLDIPFGGLRLRKQGGAAGHRGMLSLIEALGTQGFPRLRLGLGEIPFAGEAADFVLEEFGLEEWPVAERVADRAADAMQVIAAKGFEAAMNQFNAPPAAADEPEA